MWQSVILWGGIQHQLTLTTPPKNQFTVSVNSTQMQKIEMNTSLWTPRLLMMDGKDKISLSHRDFYLVHIKLQVSNFRLKTHFIKEMERFHITVLRVFFCTSIKAWMWKIKSAGAQEGRQQSERRNALIKDRAVLRKTEVEKHNVVGYNCAVQAES